MTLVWLDCNFSFSLIVMSVLVPAGLLIVPAFLYDASSRVFMALILTLTSLSISSSMTFFWKSRISFSFKLGFCVREDLYLIICYPSPHSLTSLLGLFGEFMRDSMSPKIWVLVLYTVSLVFWSHISVDNLHSYDRFNSKFIFFNITFWK